MPAGPLRQLLTGGTTGDEAARVVGISRSMVDTRLWAQLADRRVGCGRAA